MKLKTILYFCFSVFAVIVLFLFCSVSSSAVQIEPPKSPYFYDLLLKDNETGDYVYFSSSCHFTFTKDDNNYVLYTDIYRYLLYRINYENPKSDYYYKWVVTENNIFTWYSFSIDRYDLLYSRYDLYDNKGGKSWSTENNLKFYYKGNQPEMKDITYFPALPDEYYDSVYLYKNILVDNNGNFYLILSKQKPGIIEMYGLFTFPGWGGGEKSTYSFFYDKSKVPRQWQNQGLVASMYYGDKHFYMSNYDLMSSIDGTVFYGRNSNDFIMVSLAIGSLQHYLKHDFNNLVPAGILILIGIILVRLIVRRFHPKYKKIKKGRFKKRW